MVTLFIPPSLVAVCAYGPLLDHSRSPMVGAADGSGGAPNNDAPDTTAAPAADSGRYLCVTLVIVTVNFTLATVTVCVRPLTVNGINHDHKWYM